MSAPVVEEQEALPAIFEHCQNVYAKMESEAQLVHVPSNYGREEDVEQLVWEGHLTKLFAQLHLSVPYYTSVTRELKRMGCIVQKRRGGGNAASQWVLLTEPTEELFRTESTYTPRSAKAATRMDMLEQQVRDMSKTVNKIESDYDTIVQVLKEKEGPL